MGSSAALNAADNVAAKAPDGSRIAILRPQSPVTLRMDLCKMPIASPDGLSPIDLLRIVKGTWRRRHTDHLSALHEYQSKYSDF